MPPQVLAKTLWRELTKHYIAISQKNKWNIKKKALYNKTWNKKNYTFSVTLFAII